MTNATQPAQPMLITMDDSTTPPEPNQDTTPQNADRLFKAITATMQTFINFEVQEAIRSNVERLVQRKFDEMMENRRALHLMDQALETMIDQKVEAAVNAAIDLHEATADHYSKNEIEGIAADQARETLSEYAERQEGWVTKDQVNDLITEHVDEELDGIDWEEKVKDVIREML